MPHRTPYDLLILGAGAAGMIAAIAAQETALALNPQKPLRIALLEKNREAGIKLLVCGGGRCNFTNAGTPAFLIEQFGRNGRFLTPALEHLDNTALRTFFANLGEPSHEEHDGKIYPNSNSARSVVDSIIKRLRQLHIDIFAHQTVTALTHSPLSSPNLALNPNHNPSPTHPFTVTTHKATFQSRAVLLALGGMSYQKMGTTGDGYKLAAALGHSTVTPRPAIVGLLTAEQWPKDLQGTVIEKVEVKIEVPGPLPRLATGKPTPSVNDMLFTHFGLSGPAILNPSEIVAELLEKLGPVTLRVDLVRHLTHDQLANLLHSWQQTAGNKPLRKQLTSGGRDFEITTTNPDQTASSPGLKGGRVTHSKSTSIPTRLAESILALANIPPTLVCSQLTAAHIHTLLPLLKAAKCTITETRGFKEAMVTAGGISLSEVDPHTLESKIVPHLYITGEVLDLTGPSGGYNLQLAFSTGHLAGTSAAHQLVAALPS
jgi:predicted Rossmann fold flavoprotein